MKRMEAFPVTSTSRQLRISRMRPINLPLTKFAKVPLTNSLFIVSAHLRTQTHQCAKLCLCNSLFDTGLTVVIRCPDSNNTNTATGGTALPKFAIRGMLKTFGLHGVVLDVDSVSTTLLI